MEFKQQLRKIKELNKAFTNRELAEKLEITEDAVKNWVKRKSMLTIFV